MAMNTLPYPPTNLVTRVGTVDGVDPMKFYIDEGLRLRAVIAELLPASWDWNRKRVLDFGCGSARVLRHYAPEAARGQFWGCDIDQASIRWAQANLSPPFTFFVNGSTPPLPLPKGSLDLVWAMSVFTHISDSWSDWLLEMHRLLDRDGLLIASFLGDGMWTPLVGEPYDENQVGMSVLRHWTGPEAWVFHSEWWLREHWGRAFEILHVQRPPRDSTGAPQITHSYIVLRRREVDIDSLTLKQVDPHDPREIAGLQTGLRLARRELAAFAGQESIGKGRFARAPILKHLTKSLLRRAADGSD